MNLKGMKLLKCKTSINKTLFNVFCKNACYIFINKNNNKIETKKYIILIF